MSFLILCREFSIRVCLLKIIKFHNNYRCRHEEATDSLQQCSKTLMQLTPTRTFHSVDTGSTNSTQFNAYLIQKYLSLRNIGKYARINIDHTTRWHRILLKLQFIPYVKLSEYKVLILILKITYQLKYLIFLSLMDDSRCSRSYSMLCSQCSQFSLDHCQLV